MEGNREHVAVCPRSPGLAHERVRVSLLHVLELERALLNLFDGRPDPGHLMAPAARKPRPLAAVPSAPKVIAKPTPVDAADAAAGRKLRAFLGWATQLVAWALSGLLATTIWVTYPDGGLWGAVAMNAVLGALVMVAIVRWARS